MTAAEAALLGILQGLTEFLPVSSSGHLVLAETILGARMPGVVFEVAAHLGTTLAVLFFYRRAIAGMVLSLARRRRKPLSRLALLIAAGSVPAAVLGKLFADDIEPAFPRPIYACLFLAVTGAVLLTTFAARRGTGRLGLGPAMVVGGAQAAALLPGLSRSGLTISAGILCGVRRRRAVRFSFLLSVPAVLGACALKAASLPALPHEDLLPLAIGAVLSFAAGLVALRAMVRFTTRGWLPFFGFYCLGASLLGVLLLA
jgi:undecaprenyl-diphosphatase